tara:strand:- start:246 stop:1370 length:1125 start_codon:yes stop_codon:yes gene_type:complete
MNQLVISNEYTKEWWEMKNYTFNSWQPPARDEHKIEGVEHLGMEFFHLKDIVAYEQDQPRSDDNLDKRVSEIGRDLSTKGFRPECMIPQVVMESSGPRVCSGFARDEKFREIVRHQPEAMWPFDVFRFESKAAEIKFQISVNDHGSAFKNTENDLIKSLLKLNASGRLKHDKTEILNEIERCAPNFGSDSQKDGVAKKVFKQIEKKVVAEHIMSFSESKLRNAVNNARDIIGWGEYSVKGFESSKRLTNENGIVQRVYFGKTSEFDSYLMRDFFKVLEDPSMKMEIASVVKDTVSAPSFLRANRQQQYDKFKKYRSIAINIIMRNNKLNRKEVEKTIDDQIKFLGWVPQDMTNEIDKGVLFVSLSDFLTDNPNR